MTLPEHHARTTHVTIAGAPCEVTVSPCPLSALGAGEHIVGPDGVTLLEVWTWRGGGRNVVAAVRAACQARAASVLVRWPGS